MPNMANITVKKADGTTDVVYTALTPSAGDKTSARWSLTASSTKANLRLLWNALRVITMRGPPGTSA